ncbi:amyloid beta A4 precursor protein-binding family B member 2-like, partial [Tropilaelaps mercedesae]
TGNAAEKALKRQSCPILSRRAIDQMIQSNQKKAIRFAVRSLGWLEVPEEELTPEKSSRAVNSIIKQLGSAKDSGGTDAGSNANQRHTDRWGGGIDIYMDIDDECLRLIDPNKIKSKIVEIDDLCTDDDVVLSGLASLSFGGPSTMSSEEIGDEDECILLEQPIHTIRMWGVGRDKDRYGQQLTY